MFSASERWNRIGSCCTIAICARRLACVTPAMSWPSIRMRPPFTSCSRWMSLTNVVLREPDQPDLLARADGDAEPVIERLVMAAVVERDVLECDPAMSDRDRLRAGPV